MPRWCCGLVLQPHFTSRVCIQLMRFRCVRAALRQAPARCLVSCGSSCGGSGGACRARVLRSWPICLTRRCVGCLELVESESDLTAHSVTSAAVEHRCSSHGQVQHGAHLRNFSAGPRTAAGVCILSAHVMKPAQGPWGHSWSTRLRWLAQNMSWNFVRIEFAQVQALLAIQQLQPAVSPLCIALAALVTFVRPAESPL